MKQYNIYQLQRVNEVFNHDDETGNDYSTYDAKLNVIATYDVKNSVEPTAICESAWQACNVDCWDDSWHPSMDIDLENITVHPNSLFKGFCNSDIIVETSDGFYKAESFGWKKIESLENGVYRIIYQYTFINWRDIRNKSDFDEKKLDAVIEQVRAEYDERHNIRKR